MAADVPEQGEENMIYREDAMLAISVLEQLEAQGRTLYQLRYVLPREPVREKGGLVGALSGYVSALAVSLYGAGGSSEVKALNHAIAVAVGVPDPRGDHATAYLRQYAAHLPRKDDQ